MSTLKSAIKLAFIAMVLLGINGVINLSLMIPLHAPGVINQLRLHLDDGAFALVFGLVALIFWAMFTVLPRERGFVYLGTISFLTALQLFWDWDGRSILFGSLPQSPQISLLPKCMIMLLFFSFVAYLLNVGKNRTIRMLQWMGAALCVAVLLAITLPVGETGYTVLDLLFLVNVFLNVIVGLSQFLILLRHKKNEVELRFIGWGFILFAVVLLPDPAKDVLQILVGHPLGYLKSFWEECLEDTFAWALLSLLCVFGIIFFRRFVQTMKDNQSVSDELKAKNIALEQEVETRERLDQMFSEMLRTYRIADLEIGVLREGQQYFHPNRFALLKYDASSGSIGFKGPNIPSSQVATITEALQYARNAHPSGDAIVMRDTVLAPAGGTGKVRLFLAVYSEHGTPISMEERVTFTLLLMAKYVSIFYDYFESIESRIAELENRQEKHTPWLSKLFMQMAEKERKRLASDLHDEVLQELLHIRRLLDRTRTVEGWQQHVDELRIGIENAEFMIRETCSELIPSFLSDRGVVSAVTQLVEKTKLRADFHLEFQATHGELALNDEQMTAIYRIVQELINNATKHSEANWVTLQISQEASRVLIRYADDGKGMDTDAVFSSTNRLGVRGMMERVHMLEGDIEVTSTPGHGVIIECSVPV